MCFGPELAAAGSAIADAAATAAPYVGAASAAASLGSAYANNRAANIQNAAQQQALQANAQKQHALQSEADQAILGTAQNFDPAKQQQQLQALQATRTAAAQPVPIPTQGYQTTTSSAPPVIQSDQERQLAQAQASGRQAATRSGALQGYGDTALSNQIRIGRAGQQVGQLANFSQGLSNTLPFQLSGAYGHGQNWAGAGTTLDALGRLGTLYSLTRNKAPGNVNWAATDPYAQGYGGGWAGETM